MDGLSRFCCLNSECPEYGKRGVGNLSVTSRYGPGKARRMLRCQACKARFSERKGAPLFDSRLPAEKVESVLEHIAEGCGVRQAGRLCKVDRGTVGRPSRIAGDHSRDLHKGKLVALSNNQSFTAHLFTEIDQVDFATVISGIFWLLGDLVLQSSVTRV